MSSNHQFPREDTGGNINFTPFSSTISDKSLISIYWTDIINKPSFCNVSLTGSYNDLSNKPLLASVATSGSYNDLSGKSWFISGNNTYSFSNIGIGTANPNYKLDVSGDINFTGSLNQNGLPFKTSQWTNSNTSIYYNLGNVGIGKTTAINEKLDINGNLRIAGNIYPATTSNYDLGSSNNKWRDLYLSGNSIYLDNLILSKNTTNNLEIKDNTNNYKGIVINELTINSNNFNNKINVDTRGFLVFNNSNYPVFFANNYDYSNIVLSNVLTSTSNNLNSKITAINTDTIPLGNTNRFIVNDIYNRNITFTGTLTSSNIITSNISVIGDTTILNTTVYQTEQLQVNNNTPATSMLITQVNNSYNLAEFYNNTTPALVINSTGNTGIGNATPVYKLDVGGTINTSTELFIKGTNVSNIIDGKITTTSNILVNYNNLTNRPSLATVATTGIYSDLIGEPFITTGNDIYSAYSGNTGIGIATPAYKLDVNGTINTSSEIFIKGTNVSNIIDGKITTTSNILVNYNNLTNRPSLATVATTGNYNDLAIKPLMMEGTSNYNDLTNKTWINNGNNIYNSNSANVGIGIATPAYKLDVNGMINSSSEIFIKGTNVSNIIDGKITTTSNILVNYNNLTNRPLLATVATTGNYNDLNGKPSLATVATTGNYNDLINEPFLTSVNDVYSSYIGNTGIGIATPAYKLDVNGTINTSSEIFIKGTNISNIIDVKVSNTSNTLNSKITGINTDTIPLGTTNRFIVNDIYNRNITFTGTLTSSNVITSNLSVIGDTTILNTTFYQTEQLQVVNDTTATALIVKQMNATQNLAEFYNNTTPALVINSTGNTGIGNATPVYKLDVGGTINTSTELFIKGTNVSNIIDGKINSTSNILVNYNNLTNRPSLATVATTGIYSDLIGEPFITTGNDIYSAYSGNTGIGIATPAYKLDVNGTINTSSEIFIKGTNMSNIIDGKITTTSNILVNYNNLTNRPSLATVATTGNYNDLINLPAGGGGGGTSSSLANFSISNITGTNDSYISFTGNSKLVLSSAVTCDILVVGGGGAGAYAEGGGGGAGGVVYQQNVPMTAGTYTITVGYGGIAFTSPLERIYYDTNIGLPGTSSKIEVNGSIFTYNGISFEGKGGGGGGGGDDVVANTNRQGPSAGDNGGSGGGAGGGGGGSGALSGGSSTQGNTYFNGTVNVAGGYAGGSKSTRTTLVGGGGGGAGGAGGIKNGGIGVQLNITGTNAWYAGGGGGGVIGAGGWITYNSETSAGVGGSGIGGDGAFIKTDQVAYTYPAKRHGTDGTGSGGGGGGYNYTWQGSGYGFNLYGGNGGSGIVIIRIKNYTTTSGGSSGGSGGVSDYNLLTNIPWINYNSTTIYSSNNSNVGIGKTNPVSKLDINGDINIQGNLRISNVSLPFSTYANTNITTSNGLFSYNNNYGYYTFLSDGTITFPQATNCDLIMVGAGGNGGLSASSGGGGAGEVIYYPNYPFSAGTSNITVGDTSYDSNIRISRLWFNNNPIITAKGGCDGGDLFNFTAKSPWGVYLAEDYNSTTNQILDFSGNNRHATTSGTITKTLGAGNGATAPITYISGTSTASINFPNGSIPTNFTILSLTRYVGTNRNSILKTRDPSPADWIHGHWNGSRGTCYYQDGWKTSTASKGTLDNWLCCIGKNSGSTPGNILIDGVASGTATGGGGGQNLGVNPSNSLYTQNGDWALSVVIIWDQILSDNEMVYLNTMISNYLSSGNSLKNSFTKNINGNYGSGGGAYINQSGSSAGTKWNAAYSYSTTGANGSATVGGNGGSATANGGFVEGITSNSLILGVGGSGASATSVPSLKTTFGSGGDGNGGLGTQGIVIIKVPLNQTRARFDGYINYSNIDNRPFINDIVASRNFVDLGYYNQINFPRAITSWANEWFLYMGNSPTNVSNSFIFHHLNSNATTRINSKWWFNGTTASTNNEISDIRIKKEIIEIINPLEKLMLIHPKEYYLCDEKDYLKKYGIIAQEVKEVLPEFVYNDNDYIANVYSKATYEIITNNDNKSNSYKLIIEKEITELININDELKILLDNNYDNNQEIIIEDLPYHNRYKKRFAVVKAIINNHTIEITQELELSEEEKLNLFVYGKKVNDFQKLDYSSLYCLNLKSTQELYSKIQEQELLISNLENRLSNLENK